MHMLKDPSGCKNIGKNVLPLFQDVGALGYSSSCAGLQSLPDKFWAVEHVLFRISVEHVLFRISM